MPKNLRSRKGPNLPPIVVMASKLATAYPKRSNGVSVNLRPFGEALEREYRSDAHAIGYRSPGLKADRRVAISAAEEARVEVHHLALDFDTPGHEPHATKDDAIDFLGRLVDDELAERATAYLTVGGARLIFSLSRPVSPREADEILAGLAERFADTVGLEADPKALRWEQPFRLPSVVRLSPTGAPTPLRTRTHFTGDTDLIHIPDDPVDPDELPRGKPARSEAPVESKTVEKTKPAETIATKPEAVRAEVGNYSGRSLQKILAPVEAAEIQGDGRKTAIFEAACAAHEFVAAGTLDDAEVEAAFLAASPTLRTSEEHRKHYANGRERGLARPRRLDHIVEKAERRTRGLFDELPRRDKPAKAAESKTPTRETSTTPRPSDAKPRGFFAVSGIEANTDEAVVGEILVDTGDDLRFCRISGRFHRWDGISFVPLPLAEIDAIVGPTTRRIDAEIRVADVGEDKAAEAAAKRWRVIRKRLSNVSTIRSAFELLRSRVAFPDLSEADRARKGELFTAANGTFDLRNGGARVSDDEAKRLQIRARARFAYSPGETSPMAEAFLRFHFPDEAVRRVVLSLIARGLTGEKTLGSGSPLVAMFVGAAGSGKTTFLRWIVETLGGYAEMIDGGTFFATDSATIRARSNLLRDASEWRFVLADEIPTTGRVSASDFKTLANGDRIHTWAKHINEDQISIPWSIFGTANSLQGILGDIDGIGRRLLVVEFARPVFGSEIEVEDAAERMRSEAPGLLSFLVDRAIEFYADPSVLADSNLPDELRETRDAFTSANDIFEEFREARLIHDPRATRKVDLIGIRTIREEFLAFAKRTGRKDEAASLTSNARLIREIEKIPGVEYHPAAPVGKRVAGFAGLKIISEHDRPNVVTFPGGRIAR